MGGGVGAVRGAKCVWCRARWTPRRDLMKPSRGLLRPARCAVALVQLALPTGGLLQATEAADIKRALRRWARAAGARGEGRRSPANPNPSPSPSPSPYPYPYPTCSSAPPRLDERPDPGEWRTAREQRSTCQRVRGEGCVPCQILLRLANAGQGKPVGRAAAPARGAAAARGVSGKSVQATATIHPSGAVPARSDAKAGGASAGGGAGRSGGWGWEPAIHGSYVFEFGLGSSHQGHRIGATTCLPSHGLAGGWRRGLGAGAGDRGLGAGARGWRRGLAQGTGGWLWGLGLAASV